MALCRACRKTVFEGQAFCDIKCRNEWMKGFESYAPTLIHEYLLKRHGIVPKEDDQ